MAVVNAAVALAFRLLLPVGDGSIHLGTALFFVLLVTLLVTLYDRDRPVHEARVLARAQPAMVPS